MSWNEAAAKEAIRSGDLSKLPKKRRKQSKELKAEPVAPAGISTLHTMQDRLQRALEHLGNSGRMIQQADDLASLQVVLYELHQAIHHTTVVLLAAVAGQVKKMEEEPRP